MWSVLLTLLLAVLAHADEIEDRRCCDVPVEYHGAKDCKELLERGAHISDWYTIYPDGKPMKVYCDMHTDGGGWIVFHRRWDGSVDFTRNWKSYKEGFGSRQEYWLGNENIYRLTVHGKWEIRVDLHDSASVKYFAKYASFKLLGECEKYKLLLGHFIGGNAGNLSGGFSILNRPVQQQDNPSPVMPLKLPPVVHPEPLKNSDLALGDALSEHNNMKFSTFDEDNDEHVTAHCGVQYRGGWWFKSCLSAHLNGLYIKGQHKESKIGINWVTAKDDHYSFEHAEMKIRLVF